MKKSPSPLYCGGLGLIISKPYISLPSLRGRGWGGLPLSQCRGAGGRAYYSQTMLPPIGCIIIFIFPFFATLVFFTADLGQKLFLSAVS